MSATLRFPPRKRVPKAGAKFPPHVELILSALETGRHARQEHREIARLPFRAEATLRLFSDLPDTGPWPLYTRDMNCRGIGFITSHRLPLGYGGMLDLQTPDGRAVSIQCTLTRCREAAPGWYEGSLQFNREQSAFAADHVDQVEAADD
jgi:hypothetical protein